MSVLKAIELLLLSSLRTSNCITNKYVDGNQIILFNTAFNTTGQITPTVVAIKVSDMQTVLINTICFEVCNI